MPPHGLVFLTSRGQVGLIAAGIATFVAGYGIFLTTRTGASAGAGVNNEIAIAGTVGVALVMIGILEWAAGLALGCRGATRLLRRPLGCHRLLRIHSRQLVHVLDQSLSA